MGKVNIQKYTFLENLAYAWQIEPKHLIDVYNAAIDDAIKAVPIEIGFGVRIDSFRAGADSLRKQIIKNLEALKK